MKRAACKKLIKLSPKKPLPVLVFLVRDKHLLVSHCAVTGGLAL